MGRGAAEAGPAGRPGHDLKTPLTIISGNAELLDEDNLPPAQQACVQAILRGARSAEDYVTHLQAITTGFPRLPLPRRSPVPIWPRPAPLWAGT